MASFDFESLKRIRSEASAAWHLLPKRDFSEGWSLSPHDPAVFLRFYAPLRLRSGYRLWAYETSALGNTSTLLYALPEGTPAELIQRSEPHPDQPQILWSQAVGLPPAQIREPRPTGALANFMQAIEGDGSPWSYILASFLARDGEELGGSWHGSVWGEHQVLEEDPFWPPERLAAVVEQFLVEVREGLVDPSTFVRRVSDAKPLSSEEALAFLQSWTWSQLDIWRMVEEYFYLLMRTECPDLNGAHRRLMEPIQGILRSSNRWEWTERPLHWEPGVTVGDTVEVVFHTYSGLLPEGIYSHCDRYQPGNYRPERVDRLVGQGEGGYLH